MDSHFHAAQGWLALPVWPPEGGCCLVPGYLRELRLELGFGSPTRGHCARWYPSNCRKERRKMTLPPSLSVEQQGHVPGGRPPRSSGTAALPTDATRSVRPSCCHRPVGRHDCVFRDST